MKAILWGATLILMSISIMGCDNDDIRITPSNQVTTVEHSITEFSDLLISDVFQVYIRFSSARPAMQIEANSNLHSFIEIKQDDDELSIELDDDVTLAPGTSVLDVYLSVPNIETIEARGAARVILEDHWQTELAEVELTGASSCEGTVITNRLVADLTGASILTIEGSALTFDIEAKGGSEMTGFDFVTEKLSADLQGACHLTLTVNDELNVKANGGSSVRYRGTGVVNSQDLSGGSTIIKE